MPREIATRVYFWEDGEVAAYGYSRGKPHRRVFVTRDAVQDRPVKTSLTSLLVHCLSNDGILYRKGSGDKHLLTPAPPEFFWNFVKLRFPKQYLNATSVS